MVFLGGGVYKDESSLIWREYVYAKYIFVHEDSNRYFPAFTNGMDFGGMRKLSEWGIGIFGMYYIVKWVCALFGKDILLSFPT